MGNIRKESFFRKLWHVYVIIILGAIFFVPTLSSIFTVVFALTTIWYVYKNPEAQSRFKKRAKSLFLLTSIYWIAIIGLLWTESVNLDYGLSKLETQVSLLIFPLIFACIRVTKDDILKIIYYLSIVFILIFISFSIYTFFNTEGDFNVNSWLLSLREKAHRTYVALYVLTFGFIIFIDRVNNTARRLSFLGYFFLLTSIIITQLFESRIAFLCIPVLTFITFIYIKDRMYRLIFGLSVIVLLTIVSIAIIPNSERVNNFVKKYEHSLSNKEYYKVEDRFIVWISSFDIIRDNYLIGVGTGDSPSETLKACKENTVNLRYTDVHNQYLDFLIKYGLIGLALLFSLIIYPIVLSIRKKNPYYIIFLVSLLIFFIVESVINRQIGVMYYAVLNSMFYFNLIEKSEE